MLLWVLLEVSDCFWIRIHCVVRKEEILVLKLSSQLQISLQNKYKLWIPVKSDLYSWLISLIHWNVLDAAFRVMQYRNTKIGIKNMEM